MIIKALALCASWYFLTVVEMLSKLYSACQQLIFFSLNYLDYYYYLIKIFRWKGTGKIKMIKYFIPYVMNFQYTKKLLSNLICFLMFKHGSQKAIHMYMGWYHGMTCISLCGIRTSFTAKNVRKVNCKALLWHNVHFKLLVQGEKPTTGTRHCFPIELRFF